MRRPFATALELRGADVVAGQSRWGRTLNANTVPEDPKVAVF